MKDLVEYIAQSLVDSPEKVEVTEQGSAGRRVINLKVDPADMGRVIGKQGRIAQAMRNLLKVSASYQYGERGNSGQPVLTITDTEGGRGRSHQPGGERDIDLDGDA